MTDTFIQPPGRRTHGVYHTEDDAREAYFNLGRLLNGTPVGYAFAIWQRMGKFALISYRTS